MRAKLILRLKNKIIKHALEGYLYKGEQLSSIVLSDLSDENLLILYDWVEAIIINIIRTDVFFNGMPEG